MDRGEYFLVICWHSPEDTDVYKINTESAYLPTFFFLIYGAFDVAYYSLLTTVHRAAATSPSVEITSACYEAAKKSLQAHFQFLPAFKSFGDVEILSSYVSWILLYASWTPLIVVFLHAIAASSYDDVRVLEEVQESLEPLQNFNQQSEQVYGLSKIFSKVARAFVERNSTFVGTYNPQDDIIVMPQQTDQNQFHNAMMAPPSMQFENGGHLNIPDLQPPNFDGTEMDAMSMFFGNFIGGSQPVGNLWAMDFTDNVQGGQN